MLIAVMFMGCSQDYGVVNERVETIIETEYVEVETEVIVEIPVVIKEEVEVEADPGEVWVDSFVQPLSVNGVDILWVIDTSGSMGRFNSQLLASLETMMNNLPESGWRLAMISNSPPSAGIEAQFPLVPGDTIADAEHMFNSMHKGPYEKGFDASYEYIVNNSYSSTWMRADAALLVVFVSDEEEQSTTSYPNVSDYTAWYSQQRPSGVFMSSIVQLDATISLCPQYSSSFAVGKRYIDATNYYNGVVVDICDPDWSTGVTDASQQIDPFGHWELTHIPEDDSIVVFVNEQVFTDWTYDSANNSVNFTVLPDGGAWVEIGYRYMPSEDTGTDIMDTGDTGN